MEFIVAEGLVPYEEAWERQRELHAARVAGSIPDTVLLLEHPPVYTATRRTQPWALPNDGTPVVQTDRGGDITWHGPGQLVGYPIVALPGRRDVVAYVRRLEALLMAVCAEFGVATERIKGRSGVWVRSGARGAEPRGTVRSAARGAEPGGTVRSGARGAEPEGTVRGGGPDRKIAALGLRVAQGVAMHGFALNCNPDLSAFARIAPCGYTDAGATSLSAELGRDVTVAEALPVVQQHLPGLMELPIPA